MSSEEQPSELQREYCQQLAQPAVVERSVIEAIESEISAAKRAQYEAFNVKRTGPGVNTVRGESHENADEHSHRVVIKGRMPGSCASLVDTYHEDACKRRVAIVICEPNLEVVTSSEGDREPEIVTDGGRTIEHPSEYEQQTDRRPRDCNCLPMFDDLPCWPCYLDGFRMPNPNATLDD